MKIATPFVAALVAVLCLLGESANALPRLSEAGNASDASHAACAMANNVYTCLAQDSMGPPSNAAARACIFICSFNSKGKFICVPNGSQCNGKSPFPFPAPKNKQQLSEQAQ